MKILLLSVTAGYGHHATAKALADLFEQKGAEVQIVDVYEYISKMIQQALAKGYLLSSKYTPELYRLFYDKTSQTKEKLNKMNIVKLVNTLGAFRFESFVENFEPDAIVCTHVLAAHLVSQMKQRGMVTAPSIGIATDYCIHPYWEDVLYMDGLVTASELITQTAVKRGIPEERLLPFGIPVHPKFNRHIAKEEARRQLGLDVERPVLLVMSGSMGYGDCAETVQHITNTGVDFQILAVCGNNKKAYQHLHDFLERYTGSCSIRVMGFVDNVDILMSAADCIITKPGGLTVTEAIAKRLPMILANPIPGQEERNVEFLVNNGMAMLVTKTFPLDEVLYALLNNPVRIQTMEETITALGHPDASERLVTYVMDLVNARQEQTDLLDRMKTGTDDKY